MPSEGELDEAEGSPGTRQPHLLPWGLNAIRLGDPCSCQTPSRFVTTEGHSQGTRGLRNIHDTYGSQTKAVLSSSQCHVIPR